MSTTLKTMFLNPPSYEGFDGGAGSRYQARREIRSFWYPTWLAQPAAMVEGSRLVDAPAHNQGVEDVLALLPEYELVVIHTSTPSYENDARLAKTMKEKKPGLKVGMVGPHASVLPQQALEGCPELDFVGRKEFDYSTKAVAEGTSYEAIRGLSYRDGDGKIRHNPDQPTIENLDALPHVIDVYKRDLTVEDYYIGYLLHPYVSLYTGRGCPARCTFCLWPQTIGGHTYRTRTPDNVLAEMTKAKEYFPQVKEFFFDDDTFTANVTRAREIALGLKKLGITWSCNSRANVPYEHLKFLKECGLRLLLVGYESGNEEMLKRIEKGVPLATARRFTQDAKDLGIRIHGTFILGLPLETRETIEQTIQYACDLDPDTIQVSMAAAYPGTKMHQDAVANQWFRPGSLVGGEGYQEVALQYPGADASDISDGVDRMYRKFYFRPRKIFSILSGMVTDVHEFMRRMREGREFLGYLWSRRKKAHQAVTE
jgi:hopanoid biosynthesis associated radical SAM protein HpnJ